VVVGRQSQFVMLREMAVEEVGQELAFVCYILAC
jgi:hypothetical protein